MFEYVKDKRMATSTLEERVSELEAKVASLQEKNGSKNEKSWIDRWYGVYKDDDFAEAAMRLGQEYRRSQPNAADSPDAITF